MTSRHLKWSGEDWENRAGRKQQQVRHHPVSIFQDSFLMVHTRFEFEQQAQAARLCTQCHFDSLFELSVSGSSFDFHLDFGRGRGVKEAKRIISI